MKINNKIFEAKYQQNDERYVDMCKRVSFNKEQFEAMFAGEFMPAGRQLAARGFEDFKTLFNCYVIGFRNIDGHGKDSKMAISDLERRADVISSKGGGIGINFSALRPSTAIVSNLGNGAFSSGMVSFMDRFAYTQKAITQGGSRRGALIGVVNVDSPSVIDFINCKQDLTKMNNMNISVMISDKFIDAVKHNLNWDLVFPDFENISKQIYNDNWNGDIEEWKKLGYPIKVYQTIKAKTLWDNIIENAWKTGEPGILFEDNINNVNNYKDIIKLNTCNPCGEKDLPVTKDGEGSSCNLGSINLKMLFTNKINSDYSISINWLLFDRLIKIGVEYLDMAIDKEHYFSEGIEKNQKYFRDIGLGIIGYADLLILMKLKYGSSEAIQFTDKLMSFMLNSAYYHSSKLAEKYGKAPVFNDIKMNDYYYKKCDMKTRTQIDKFGLRNGRVLTAAPGGSISMLLNVNGGIEPYYQFEYERNDILGKRIIVPEIVKELQQFTTYDEYKPYLISTEDISPQTHVKVQATFQNWIDSSISKTINLPANATKEDVSNAYILAHSLGIKGTTVYRDGCRAGVLNKIDKDSEVLEHELIRQFKDAGDNVIVDGINPPKESHLIRTKIKTNKGKKYYFMVGYVTEQGNKPFEFFIFTNHNEKNDVTHCLIDEMIEFLKTKGIKEKLIISIQNKMEKQNNVSKIARLISAALRHNIKIIEIANVLEKYTESVSSLIFWIRKHLLSLLEDGIKTDKICPDCGGKLIYVDGCISCENPECGYSKCG